MGIGAANRQVVRELIEQKDHKVRQGLPGGEDWSFHYADFARAGFAEAATTALSVRQGLVVDLTALDEIAVRLSNRLQP
jgi:hypothetical protein